MQVLSLTPAQARASLRTLIDSPKNELLLAAWPELSVLLDDGSASKTKPKERLDWLVDAVFEVCAEADDKLAAKTLGILCGGDAWVSGGKINVDGLKFLAAVPEMLDGAAVWWEQAT